VIRAIQRDTYPNKASRLFTNIVNNMPILKDHRGMPSSSRYKSKLSGSPYKMRENRVLGTSRIALRACNMNNIYIN
jgi:hypothetical protein